MGGKPDFDIGIIGGGPGGASMAAYLAKAGVSCVVFERDLFPRPHVGESLVPSSTRVFKDLDFLGTMEHAGFPRKFGAVWTSDAKARVHDHDWEGLSADTRADIRFDEREQEGVNQNYTWHVDRGKFDLLLLQHAHKLGAQVYEGLAVRGVDFTADLPKIQFTIGKKRSSVKVRAVVDASGRRTLLGNHLKLKVNDPVFDQYAIHTWFEGFDRGTPEKADYIFIHFLPLTNSWVWQIPITDTITSIGVVTQKKNFAKSHESREEFFWDCVRSRPEIHENLKQAEQLRPLQAEGDYSYAMRQIVGDGWVMVGDAARFVDPIFSTGVSIALNSSSFAQRDILAHLESGGAFTKAAFADYEATIKRGTRNWHDFITVYYRLNVLFTAFIKDRRYRLDVLRLLQGDVYDEEQPPVLARMKKMVRAVETTPDHVWHHLLGDLTANAFVDTF